MGAVTVDLYRKERPYKDLSLSDENVVKYLLLYRSKVDILCNIHINRNIYHSGDTTEFNQELIALYASLDNIIAKIELKDRDLMFLDLLFKGNDVSDIINIYNIPKVSAYRILQRITSKIVEENERNWKEVVKRYRRG